MSSAEAPAIRCPLDSAILRRTRHEWQLVCPRCGLEASTLEPVIVSADQSHELAEDERRGGLHHVRTENGRRLLNAISHTTSGRRLLDVGSGPGFFLRLASAAGYAVSGVEPDRQMARQASSEGFTVHSGFFPDALPHGAEFDVIILNDVLEHIPDLDLVFAGFRQHLSDCGLLVLNSPDRNGVIFRLAKLLDRIGISTPFERMWQKGLPSPHVWYFTRQQLRELSERHGFDWVTDVDLITLSREGLFERISYVKGQGRIFNFAVFFVMWLLTPVLSLFPSDIGAVIMRKNPE